MLGKHPLSGLDGAGTMLSLLRKQFHSLLQTTADIMPKVRPLALNKPNAINFKKRVHNIIRIHNNYENE